MFGPICAPPCSQGVFEYDFGDTAGLTPLLKMHTLGSGFIPDRWVVFPYSGGVLEAEHGMFAQMLAPWAAASSRTGGRPSYSHT